MTDDAMMSQNSASRDSCSRCGEPYLQETTHRCRSMPESASQSKKDAIIGKVIGGKYEIISLLGQGGMSVVYKAKQFPLNKIVALKMLLSHLSGDESSVRRFLQEAKAAGQLSHPNLVSVTDFGISEEKQAFLVMEYLEGETLHDRIKRTGAIPYKEALKLFAQVIDGLAAAHKANVIHRDLKPSNIFLQNNDGVERVLLVDFGIAKLIDAETQHLTRTGEVFGSPLYMSPEQCQGLLLDKRSDIYSLGVVFYEALCGHPPLSGSSALDTMRLHMQEMPESLQKKLGLAGKIPLSLENMVFKMMSKDRDKRQASAAELARELAQISSGESSALSGNLTHMGREISRKSKVLTVASALLIVFALVGVLSYPGFCSALSAQQYDKGKRLFNQQNYKEAASSLDSAVEFSRIAGNTAAENKALTLIIDLYKKTGDRAKLRQARDRRLEIVQTELEKLGLSASPEALIWGDDSESKKGLEKADSSISKESLKAGSQTADPQIATLPVPGSPQAFPASSPVQGESDAIDQAETSTKEYESSKNSKPILQLQQVQHISAKGVLKKAASSNSRLPGGAAGAGGAGEPGGGVLGVGHYEDLTQIDSCASVRKRGGSSSGPRTGVSTRPIGVSANSSGSSVSAVARAGSSASPVLCGSRGSSSSSAVLGSAEPLIKMPMDPLFELRSKVAEFKGPIYKGAASLERLDRLKAASESYLKQNNPNNAMRCADAGIAMALDLHESDDLEMSRLFSIAAWSRWSSGRNADAQIFADNALSFARKSGSVPETRNAEAISTVLAYAARAASGDSAGAKAELENLKNKAQSFPQMKKDSVFQRVMDYCADKF